MNRKLIWSLAFTAATVLSACSSPTSESDQKDDELRSSLAAMAVGVSDVTQETGDVYLNPFKLLEAEVRDNWVYHIAFQFDLSTGDSGKLTLDAQFLDGGEPIILPIAIYRDVSLNLDAGYDGAFQGEPTVLQSSFKVLNPERKQVLIQGSGTLAYGALIAEFDTNDLLLDFSGNPLPTGAINLNITQQDFGVWTGAATFNGTVTVHVVVSNGARVFDLRINLLTGEIT